MKQWKRLVLLLIALAVGGGLGHMLLDHEAFKIIVFLIACVVLGEIFYQIDKRIIKKS